MNIKQSFEQMDLACIELIVEVVNIHPIKYLFKVCGIDTEELRK